MSAKNRSFVFSLSCGCRGSKSLSIKDTTESTGKSGQKKPENPISGSIAGILKSPSKKPDPDVPKDLQPNDFSSSETEISLTSWDLEDCSVSVTSEDFSGKSISSFSGLLRQLSELERSLMAWTGKVPAESPLDLGVDGAGFQRRIRHSRSKSVGRIAESVAVVKNSDDPLTDFRRSMLQMIVEKEIVGVEELRELLHRFLSLNSPEHHHVILCAFIEIWNEVFSRNSYQNTPDFLTNNMNSF